MEEPDGELGNTFNNRFRFNSTLIGIAKAQSELQQKLKPYQSIIDATTRSTRMAELSGIMGIAQALQAQANNWSRDYSGIIGFSRAMQEQTKAIKPGLTFAAELARTLPKNLSTPFPGSYSMAIASIAGQHRDLFLNSQKMMPFLSSPIASQLSSMQIALNGISGNIARLVAQQGQWDLMDDFESASAQAMEFSDQLSGELELSEETERAFHALVDFVVSFINRNKKVGIYSLLFIDIVIRIASLHQYYNFLQAKPEMATKEDVKKMETRLVKEVAKKLNKEQEIRVTNYACRVYLKPKSKSLILLTLPENLEITVLQINHKWSYVSFIDPRDGYAQTGWIMKKYLVKMGMQR